MRLSVIIVTCNRCSELSHTLDQLNTNADLPHDSMEIIVVNNGSTDATAKMLATRNDLPLRVIERKCNEGVSARNYGYNSAQGQYLLVIDDDSYPVGDTVSRSLTYLDDNLMTAAVVGRVELPDGKIEASALPGIITNSAVCMRKNVILEVGGLPREFFRQAEEYDISFRIWQAGYKIARFDDLVYMHRKAPGNRAPNDIHRYDLRNNLILIERYFPKEYRSAYRRDWILRYRALAQADDCAAASTAGRWAGWFWKFREIIKGRCTLSADIFDLLFSIQSQIDSVKEWLTQHKIKTVAIADFSKNIYATWHACKLMGLNIACIYEPHQAYTGLIYRGTPILNYIGDKIEGVVLSNINPAQVRMRYDKIGQVFTGPVLKFYEPEYCPVISGKPTPFSAAAIEPKAAKYCDSVSSPGSLVEGSL